MINESDREFLHAVWNRRPVFTYFFFGFNILIFVLMTFAGGTTNDLTLEAFGAKSNVLIDQGQYWRFITPVFIHIGLIHLFFNSYALWVVGPQVERLYGGARFVLLYVLTGVGGVLGSYLYSDQPSAGASGAIFGLFGVLLVFGLRNRDSVPVAFRRSVSQSVLPVIVINLIIGFSVDFIDNSAHIAGLLTGIALAAVVPFERPGTRPHAFFTAGQFLLLALVGASFFAAYRSYVGPRIAFQNFSLDWMGGHSTTNEFVNAMNHSTIAFAASSQALNANQKADIESSIKDVGKAIDELQAIPSLSRRTDELVSQWLTLLRSQYALLQEIARGGTTTLMQNRQALQNVRKFAELTDAFKEWVNTEGKSYGIHLRRPQ